MDDMSTHEVHITPRSHLSCSSDHKISCSGDPCGDGSLLGGGGWSSKARTGFNIMTERRCVLEWGQQDLE